jgi:predicted nucleic acid binding AN1-type Zn finger protein
MNEFYDTPILHKLYYIKHCREYCKMSHCEYCKKFSAITFTCKCNKIFCTKHRMPEIHTCSYALKNRADLIEKHTQVLIASGIKSDSMPDRL